MTNPSDPQAHPPLTADDPRLSEWIDGRLSAAEAAAVERAVLGSPALARLVDDLRAIKAAARQVPTMSPPEGFAERVMEAVLSGGGVAAAADAAADRAVAQEWRQIETERIADERAEAEIDLAEAAGERKGLARADPRRGWPWLTVVTALAAGLVVAVVLNRPDGSPREVARVMPTAESEKVAAAEKAAAIDGVPPAEPADLMADARQVEPADRARKLEEQLGQAERGAAPARNAEREATTAASAPAAALARADGAAVPPLPVLVTVGAWTEFDRLLEAHGVEAKAIDDRADEGRADKPGTWTLELTGPAAGLEALLAAAGVTRPDGRRLAAGEEAKQAADVAIDALARTRTGQQLERKVLVRLVIQVPVGKGEEAGEPARAASPPAAGEGGGP